MFAEGNAVNALAQSIVQSQYPQVRLAFASADGGHYVYNIEW
jgi:hypothetical protein